MQPTNRSGSGDRRQPKVDEHAGKRWEHFFLVTACLLAATLLACAAISRAQSGSFTEFTVPTSGSGPKGIAAGSDGALWFTEFSANKIGRITIAGAFNEYTIPTAGSGPWAIVSGPDGALWFTEYNGNKIGRITTSGAITEYPIPTPNSQPEGIATNLWFTESNANKLAIASTSGVTEVTYETLATANSHPAYIAPSWIGGAYGFVTEQSGDNLVYVTTDGAFEYTTGATPEGVTSSATGGVWVAEYGAGALGEFFCNATYCNPGPVEPFTIPWANAKPWGIVFGPDGALWFTDQGANSIGRFVYGGQVYTQYSLPAGGSVPYDIVAGPDNAMWFAEFASNKIGRVGTSLSLTITTTSLPGGTVNTAYPTTTLQAAGGTTPYTWSATGLPPGLTLNSAGVLSGTPTASGSFIVTVTVADSSAPQESAMRTFSIVINSSAPAQLPTLISITPNSGAQGATVPVTLTGTNFVSVVGINIGFAGTVTNMVVVNSTEITATFNIATTAAAGAASVSVTTAAGVSNSVTFTIVSGAPTITYITPNSGVQGTVVPVTLAGTNFISGALVQVSSGVTVSAINVVSTTQITATFTIAATATPGAVSVTVTTSAGTSNAVTFTIISTGPTLTSVSPNSGAQGTTVPVTLTGTNFISGATVNTNNNGVSVSSVSVLSATQITATFTIAGNATPGPTNVTVTTTGGTSNAVTFTITSGAPTITSITPNSGVQGTTVPVTIIGTNYVTGAQVTIGNSGVSVSSVSVVSATQITATFTIANNATPGAANVTVTTSAGTSNAVTFTILGVIPTLTSVSPNNGEQGTSVPVTLTGTGFVSGATVNTNNNGVSVSSVSVVSATQITATFTIASSATTGAANVTVTTSAGTSGAVTFTIVAPVSGMTLTLTSTSSSTQSQIGVSLSSAPTAQLNGTLTLSFTPDPNLMGLPANYSDPAMQFAAGGTTLTFTVAAGSAAVTLPQNGAFQQGTVAGVITVTLTQLTEGGVSVLPSPAPSKSVTVAMAAPVISSGSVEITGLTSTGFNVQVTAHSNSRDLSAATITFQAAGGGQLTGTTSFTISLSSVAPAWFSSTTGLQNGGTFKLVVPFSYSGDTSALGGVSVTLTNSIGASSAVSGGVQ